MKKNIIIVAAILTAAMLFTGCSKGNGDVKANENTGKENSADQDQSKSDADAGKSNSGDGSEGETTILFGKVNTVTGNELEVSLAKDPYADQAQDNGENADGSMAASITAEASSGSESDTGAQQAPKIELELTGEDKSITVPAGAKIMSPTGGDAQLNSIKKGSVIMMVLQNGSVKEIGILE